MSDSFLMVDNNGNMMKMRILLLIAWVSAVRMGCLAQQKVSASERDEMIRQVVLASEGIRTVQCEFLQEKKLSLLNECMISKGKMYFKSPNMLSWEYMSPYVYTFVLNKQKVLIKSQGKKDVIDVRTSRLFTEIARIMMGSVTGSCLRGDDDFFVEMLKDKARWVARLTPKSSGLKRIFSLVTLYINPNEKMVDRIEMKEKTGDVTYITLSGILMNHRLNEKVFAID